jgi:hypothetical protein
MMKRAVLFLGLGLFLLALSACQPFVPTGDFIVTVITKTPANPEYHVGADTGYVINGVEAAVLTLTRGTKYTFGINAPGHPFYLTTDANGGPGYPGEITGATVTGQATETGEMTFTPDATTPNLIYYQCGVHTNMGWQITITG